MRPTRAGIAPDVGQRHRRVDQGRLGLEPRRRGGPRPRRWPGRWRRPATTRCGSPRCGRPRQTASRTRGSRSSPRKLSEPKLTTRRPADDHRPARPELVDDHVFHVAVGEELGEVVEEPDHAAVAEGSASRLIGSLIGLAIPGRCRRAGGEPGRRSLFPTGAGRPSSGRVGGPYQERLPTGSGAIGSRERDRSCSSWPTERPDIPARSEPVDRSRRMDRIRPAGRTSTDVLRTSPPRVGRPPRDLRALTPHNTGRAVDVSCDLVGWGSSEASAAEIAGAPEVARHARRSRPPAERAAQARRRADGRRPRGRLEGIGESRHGPAGFGRWRVLAAPRFLGRAAFERRSPSILAEGAWGVSPHLIPGHSLHSPSGTISQALQAHGPNLGRRRDARRRARGPARRRDMLEAGWADGVWLV